MDGLTSAAIQSNRARTEDRRQAEFAKLPPAEQATIMFEGLMKRWPLNSWWRFFWTGKRLTEELSNWRAELSNLCLATDAELLKSLATKKLKSNKLSKLLVQELLALVNYRAARNTEDLTRYTK